MFTILNRLRGTRGYWAKIIAVVIAGLVYAGYGDWFTAVIAGLGYVLGESIGWGLWIGTLTVQRGKSFYIHTEREGSNSGIQWLAEHILPPSQTNWLWHCRLALFIRGLYWWIPVLAPLAIVGVSAIVIISSVLVLAIGFPMSAEVGYYLGEVKKIKTKYAKGGWEIAEVVYGIIMDVVLLGIIICTILN